MRGYNFSRMALLIALSPTALERAQMQRKEQVAASGGPSDAEKRKDLVARLKQLDEPSVVAMVEKLGLPATTKTWTLDQLEQVVTGVENAGQEETGETAGEARVFTLAYVADGSSIVVGPGMTNEEWEAYNPPDGHEAVMVSAAEELAEIPNDVLLAVVNQAKGTKVKKFANPDAARDQAFESLGIILDKQNTTAEAAAPKAPKAPKTPKEPKAPAAPKLINREPKAKDQIKPVGEGTKIAKLIELLSQEDGTTIEEIEAELSATGKPVKAAAWLGYDLNTVTGYGVRQDADTKRLYLVLPAGMKEVLPYKEKKAPTPPKAKSAAEPVAEVEAPAAPAAAPAPKAAPAAKKVAPAAGAAAAKPAPKAAAPAAPAVAPAAKRALPPALAAANAKKAAEKAAAAATPAKPAAKAAPAKAPAKKGGK